MKSMQLLLLLHFEFLKIFYYRNKRGRKDLDLTLA